MSTEKDPQEVTPETEEQGLKPKEPLRGDAPACPAGQHWDSEAKKCVNNPLPPDPTHP